ncbi:trehalose transport system permease protein SugB [bacterium BMS3Abin05]|nr:trehalose transport system permease protein SugB [bacterium BMS3Abin05]GBE28915.1 trehalose transport system permease protein SugB [bacterium BMS3Bbin03]HDZ11718.1 carbohydrate ABC transporter permease [Bacteroidota bacterium]
MNPVLKFRKFGFFKMMTVLGLMALVLVNVFPIVLVLRQAFTPGSESVAWPLRLLPRQVTFLNFQLLWRTQSLLSHLSLSFWVALATTLLSLLMGFPAGWAAARSRALESISTQSALLSRVLPPIAIAIPLTAIFIPFHLYNHPMGFGLILAHLTIGLPFAILVAYAAFRDLPRELEEAAAVDGCSTVGAFVRISLPVSKGALAAAFILIFLLSWDEFTYALLIQLTHRTMPPLIYYYTEFGQIGSASVLAAIMLIPAVLVIAFLQRFMARGILSGVLKE